MDELHRKLERCMEITEKCINKAKINNEKGERLMEFAENYAEDAEHYKDEEPETALEAISYAHGFLDSGVILGHITIPDYQLEEKVKQ